MLRYSQYWCTRLTVEIKLNTLVVVTDSSDTRFRYTYENVYGKSSNRYNIKNLDFWHVAGNHDHKWQSNIISKLTAQHNHKWYKIWNFDQRGNASAQSIYSNTQETNFKMPNLWYSYTIEKQNGLSMKLIMIDTNIMKGSSETINMPDSDVVDYQWGIQTIS